MLKPYVCVACEKVILSQPDGVPSLISLFSKMIVTVPEEGSEIPKNAVAPKEWALYSSWDPEPGDEVKDYFHCVQVLCPDDSQFGDISRKRIEVQANKRAQMHIQILGFPVSQPGFHRVLVWIEEKSERVFGPVELRIELEVVKQKLPPTH